MSVAAPLKRPPGHQTCYAENLAREICERTALGETLSSICRDPKMPPRSSVLEWVRQDRNGFADKYARARDRLLEHWADELIEISDSVAGEKESAIVNAARLRSDNRKWLLSKLRPERYGDKLVVGGDPEHPLAQVTRIELVPIAPPLLPVDFERLPLANAPEDKSD